MIEATSSRVRPRGSSPRSWAQFDDGDEAPRIWAVNAPPGSLANSVSFPLASMIEGSTVAAGFCTERGAGQQALPGQWELPRVGTCRTRGKAASRRREQGFARGQCRKLWVLATLGAPANLVDTNSARPDFVSELLGLAARTAFLDFAPRSSVSGVGLCPAGFLFQPLDTPPPIRDRTAMGGGGGGRTVSHFRRHDNLPEGKVAHAGGHEIGQSFAVGWVGRLHMLGRIIVYERRREWQWQLDLE